MLTLLFCVLTSPMLLDGKDSPKPAFAENKKLEALKKWDNAAAEKECKALEKEYQELDWKTYQHFEAYNETWKERKAERARLIKEASDVAKEIEIAYVKYKACPIGNRHPDDDEDIAGPLLERAQEIRLSYVTDYDSYKKSFIDPASNKLEKMQSRIDALRKKHFQLPPGFRLDGK